MKRLTALLISLWLGMQIGFGYVVAPILFNVLENQSAGKIAGMLFHVSNGLGLLAWALAFLVCRSTGGYHSWDNHSSGGHTRKWIALLIALLAINEFVFAPIIAALKAGDTHILVTWLGGSFGKWHGISSVLHLVEGLIGFGLCIKLLRLETR
ncbi:DUF4149 domain-containing protein [Alysiella filiformis]|uniref:TMEM205-like domain-containing protein n=1 Tax=Alysiella filiformis DSM 16848 TaxID=1120981 RepID=A0A286E3X5_9NEIS|nr:DUF4149 domain-containing protein [Alysiella filiformis]QMT31040.1 DUF4149 domain-containing protein [Alysiella filiformis]UBQ55970.1 DUF4149 domain-containing protein [Alysiella filiformis DSM 16848]SOD65610.1 protein of unknown function [Alysiella filiformis DSM 16848]